MLNKELAAKLNKIQSLTEQRARIEKELELLLSPETKTVAPNTFDLNTEILAIISQNTGGISGDGLFAALVEKWGNIIDRRRVNAAAAYLMSRAGKLENVDGKRGTYRLKLNIMTN